MKGEIKRDDIGEEEDVIAYVRAVPKRDIHDPSNCDVRFLTATRYMNERITKVEEEIRKIKENVEIIPERMFINEAYPWDYRPSGAPNLQQYVPTPKMEQETLDFQEKQSSQS